MERNWETHLKALASTDQPGAALESLCAIIQEQVGAPLFTVMIHDRPNGRALRVYSNRDDVYPAKGWKPVVPTRYSRTVLDQHQPYINRNIDGIREVFFDHELIQSLGCESSCHVPVIVEGTILGVFNMLNVENHYTPERLQRALDLRPFAIGPLFLARKHHLAA